MRRTRSLFLAVTAGLALIATACGVTADTTAATVEGREVSVEDVSTLVSDPALSGETIQLGESTEDGTTARNALMFLILREVVLAEVERWDLQITDADREAASAGLDAQFAEAGVGEPTERSRELLVELGAAQTLLSQRLAELDPANEQDLRRLYEGSPAKWRQVCLTAVRVPAEGIDRAQGLVDRRVPVQDLPDRLEGAELIAQPSDGCFPELELFAELRRAVAGAPVGVTRGVVLVDDATGGVTGYVFRLEERRTLPFEEVREVLAGQVEQFASAGPASWIQAQTVLAEINPRYGQKVELSENGLTIEPPTAPVTQRSQRIADALAAAAAIDPAMAPPIEPSSASG